MSTARERLNERMKKQKTEGENRFESLDIKSPLEDVPVANNVTNSNKIDSEQTSSIPDSKSYDLKRTERISAVISPAVSKAIEKKYKEELREWIECGAEKRKPSVNDLINRALESVFLN